MSGLKFAVSLLLIGLIVDGSLGDTRFLAKTNYSVSDLFKTKNTNLKISQDPIAVTKSPWHEANSKLEDDVSIYGEDNSKFERRNSFVETSTFNPDVLNKFLEEYATKIKSTTEKNYKYPFTVIEPPVEPFQLEVHDSVADESEINAKENTTVYSNSKLDHPQGDENANDTFERNKQWGGGNSYDDRTGWVTLEAIPWSKSKISKWQANQDAQKPWPDHRPWEKPQSVDRPWQQRPSYNDDNAPWYEKSKPHYPDNAGNKKPWFESDRPKPNKPSRPSYFDNGDDFEDRPSYAQKWPPEKPWDKYADSFKQTPDIITDDKPTNFPSNWDKPQISKPSYNLDRFGDGNREQTTTGWNSHKYEFPPKYEELNNRPSNFPQPSSSFDRPHFSHYQYSTDHPPTHPANGDGQWVLLSTNRGYTKSRQRSIKISATNAEPQTLTDVNREKNGPDPTVAVMSSRRQVRLTVLPSVNGTNTTTSHGGLLEVEKTFKTVDQSQREYENTKQTIGSPVLTKRPIRNAGNKQPSNSAVLAAVGAGMLPATMAMMIPMMLGRKKRAANAEEFENTLKSSIFELKDDFISKLSNRRKFRKLRM
ncbi:uncharacterized protein LOC124184537 [Neodiprion fabricii]|uniref:uncharacterized protein LOC124184537 n=1 Tax=Neodiprion fabricii TaxID=2872261 RepID=UPI001ED90CA3|nr:uncharacterized protein LOC124184537 [Neodiprion fabricii]XP_046430301.1 uncharacterized protein LOC124184537 [Neodiprion fabricii]